MIIISLILLIVCLLAYFRLRLKKIKTVKSNFLGKIEILKKYNGEIVLIGAGLPQGVTINDKSIQKSYWYEMALQTVRHCKNKKNCQILMLGLGANTIPRLIAKQNPNIHQSLVEIDPAIISICEEFFQLNSLPKYTLLNVDAYKLVSQKALNKKFDVILVDIFTDEDSFVNSKSNSPDFITNLKSSLKTNGLLLFNKPSHNQKTLDDTEKLKKYLKVNFKKVNSKLIVDPRGYKNQIISVTN